MGIQFKRFLTAGLLMILAACISAGGRPVMLTEENSGQSIDINTGQQLVISLEGNPTTGYTWEVGSMDEAVLKQIGEPEFKSSSGALGAGGVMILQFQAISEGDTALRLVYHRPWEQGIAPEKTFEVNVVVK
jgi:inhibitor of cysteine peptidase